MSSGLRRAVSIVEVLRTMTLRQGRTPVFAAVAAIAAVCMFGCVGGIPSMTSSYSEIVPGTVPVDTFLTEDMYKAVKIGGVTWMAKNLDIENGNSWCLYNKSELCDVFGRLYDWETAMSICPPGWHLPSRQEWVDLEAMAGGSKVAGKRLKSSTQWNGTDDYGYSAVPAGLRFKGEFEAFSDLRACVKGTEICHSYWWTSEECDVKGWSCGDGPCEERAYVARVSSGESFENGGSITKRAGLSVRCILND